jgi:Ca2+-binding EF-hand superfamily protein
MSVRNPVATPYTAHLTETCLSGQLWENRQIPPIPGHLWVVPGFQKSFAARTPGRLPDLFGPRKLLDHLLPVEVFMTRHFWGILLLAGVCGSWVRADDIPASELFKVLDKNGDGRLVTEEIPEGQYRFFERLLRLGDQNQDGAITLNEFQAVMQLGPQEKTTTPSDSPRPSAPPPVIFPDSAPPAGNQPARDNSPIPSQVLSRLDRNGDGKLDRSELPTDFATRLEPIFQKYQTDAITVDQLLSSLPLIQQRQQDSESRKNEQGTGESTSGMGSSQANRPDAASSQRLPSARVAGNEIRFLRWLDRDNSGTLSREEIAQAANVFQQLDTNGDGELDVSELIHLGPLPQETTEAPVLNRPAQGVTPGTQTAIEFEALFSRMDLNQDGAIAPGEAPERLRKLFPLIDENGDGKLSREELREGLEQMRKQPLDEPVSNQP